jgi:hypothetical protein
MNGPYSSSSVRFSQPTSWNLQSGAVLRLDIGAYFSRQAQAFGSGGAALEVTFNKVWITTVMINWDGEKTVIIPIPDKALTPALLNGEHQLSLFLDAAVDCNNDNQTTVAIRSTSGFELPHEIISPPTALAQLPAPFYQANSFQPDQVTLVVPKNANAAEIKAALIVEAAFGRISGNKMVLPIVDSDLVDADTTADQIRQGHLIFVGKAGGFADLAQVAFPADIAAGTIQAQSIQADDGVVQTALSPWDTTKAVLYVGGTSDLAVVKAAQAFSSGTLRAGNQPDISIISDVNASIESPLPSTDRSLSDLGFATSTTLSGYGTSSAGYEFSIPVGMVAGQDAYLDLDYSHSALLDFSRSGLVILLNGQSIGSARFTEESAKSTSTLRVGLPAYALQPGVNRLDIQSNLVPVDYCSPLINSGLWVSIIPTTLIHLPLVPAQTLVNVLQPDLSRYPYPFVSEPTLSNMAFVLPQDDMLSLNIAAAIAAELGKTANGALINLGAYFGDNVPEDARQDTDFLFVGRATNLGLVEEINSNLPAPFAPGSDIAVESGLRITYRMPEGTDLGYIQLLNSPWNADRTILAVMGSTNQGLTWAGNTITDQRWRSRISGNFAVSNDTQVLTSDTRLGGVSNLSATAVPNAASPIISDVPVSVQGRPAWLLPGIVITVLALIVLIAFLFRSKRQRDELH